jgi:sugar lactone lactonase YvrE
VPTKSRKPSIDPVRWTPPPIDPLPDLPAKAVTVVPIGGDGPEDVVVDADGQLWTGLIDGRIVRISPNGGEHTVVANTGGRPLGLHVARDGRLLVCDSYRGLLALNPDGGELTSLVESVDQSDGHSSAGSVRRRALKFCSNVTETSDGTIYFTESTSAFHFEYFLGAVLEARGRGSLFRLAADGSVTTLVKDLYFANGVTVTADGSALVFAETMGRRLSKYWLTGPHAGSVTPLAVNLPAMPDNISTGSDGRIWTAMVTAANPQAEALMPKAPWIRKLIWRLPERLQPKIEPEIWVVGFDPDSGAVVGGIRTKRPDFGAVTGVVESAGRLWMSTIEFPSLAYFEL